MIGMEKWRRLDEICNVEMGQSPDSSSYNTEGMGLPFFQGNADFGNMYPKVRVWCDKPSKIVDKDTLLISVRAPIGALNFTNERSCIGRGLAGITAKERISLKYIYYFLKYKHNELNNKGTGSTFKAIAKNALGETMVKILSLEEQNACVSILDKVAIIIDKYNCIIEKLDSLIKSRFVEMFGDPIANPMGWIKYPLGKECEIVTGNTPSRKVSVYYGNYIEWIKSDNINTPNAILTTAEEYLSEEGLKVGRCVDAGAILMTCIAGSLRCIGNVAIADRQVSFNQQINGIIPRKNNTWFMYVLFELSKKEIQSSINMALKGILSKGQLAEMEFVFPPIDLQNDFADFVKQVDKSKVAIQKSINEMQLLYDSLMQKYFE